MLCKGERVRKVVKMGLFWMIHANLWREMGQRELFFGASLQECTEIVDSEIFAQLEWGCSGMQVGTVASQKRHELLCGMGWKRPP